MSIATVTDLEGMGAAGRVVAETLESVTRDVAAGVTTRELDELAESCFRKRGARSGPRRGDMVTIDVTAELNGYYADAARTVIVEPSTPVARRLKACAEAAFRKRVERARAGAPVWHIGEAVEREVHRRRFRVLRDLRGHGVGRAVHEDRVFRTTAIRKLGRVSPRTSSSPLSRSSRPRPPDHAPCLMAGRWSARREA